MAATFIVHHQHQNEHSIGTVKAFYPKIVSLPAHLISNLYTLSRAGRALQVMHGYTMMLGQRIYISRMANITLPMQDFLYVSNFSLPTVGHGIILLNGAVPMSGMICCIFVLFIYLFIYLYNYRPINKEELFNLRHASLRNVIERIFGVLKRRFKILLLAPEYSLDIQARIPVALSSIHNFIRTHEPGEEPLQGNPDIPPDDNSDEDLNPVGTGIVEQEEADVRRDKIAQDMWDHYRHVCEEQGIDTDGSSSDEDDDEDEEHLSGSNDD